MLASDPGCSGNSKPDILKDGSLTNLRQDPFLPLHVTFQNKTKKIRPGERWNTPRQQKDLFPRPILSLQPALLDPCPAAP